MKDKQRREKVKKGEKARATHTRAREKCRDRQTPEYLRQHKIAFLKASRRQNSKLAFRVREGQRDHGRHD